MNFEKQLQHYFTQEPSNGFHQLLVTVSRHFFVASSGKYSYQKKPLEATIKKPLLDRGRKSIVHFMIIDKMSECFYVETHTGDKLPSVIDFLHRAWSLKENHLFCGMPQQITVPGQIRTPELSRLLREFGIEDLQATSGFASGIPAVKKWEKQLAAFYYKKLYFSSFSKLLPKYASLINAGVSNSIGYNYNKYWLENLHTLRIPPDLIVFKKPYLSVLFDKPQIQTTSSEESIKETQVEIIRTTRNGFEFSPQEIPNLLKLANLLKHKVELVTQ